LLRDVPKGRAVGWNDVAFDADNAAVKFRREMEQFFSSSI
jgi:predicted homoserine dehydrogenase-like protein